jgi:hypothetical protein
MNQDLSGEGNVAFAADRDAVAPVFSPPLEDKSGAADVPAGLPGDSGGLDYLILTKGFSRVFWGLALTAVLLLSHARIEVFSGLHLPAFFLGTIINFWGLLTLWRAGKVSASWRPRLALATILVLMEIYFVPFVRWWNAMPYVSFYTINVGLMAAAAILLLYQSNVIAADLFRCLAMKGERLEARLYAGSVIAFIAVPLAAAIAFAVIAAARYQTMFLDELCEAVHCVPIWLYVIVTIPYSLTLAILWKARDRSYQQFCMAKKPS